jgi:hypothetical protein
VEEVVNIFLAPDVALNSILGLSLLVLVLAAEHEQEEDPRDDNPASEEEDLQVQPSRVRRVKEANSFMVLACIVAHNQDREHIAEKVAENHDDRRYLSASPLLDERANGRDHDFRKVAPAEVSDGELDLIVSLSVSVLGDEAEFSVKGYSHGKTRNEESQMNDRM